MNWAEALFRPRAVAVYGSARPGKIGRVLVDHLLDGGYREVVVVNPRAEGTEHAGGVRSLDERLPEAPPVDLAVVATPAPTVEAVVADAGGAGVAVAVVITAGFAEAGDADAEGRLLRTAASHGIRLVGPNCAGIVNTKHHLYPTLETRPPCGDVAFVSQSGALGGAVLSWAEQQGLGFSKFISYGNAIDLTDVDFLDMLRDDDESRVVAVYLETVSDGRRFLEIAGRLAEVKPLVVIKSGRSSAGGRATRSHTGSLAGEDAVFDAALRQAGALRVDGIEELFDLCRGFVALPRIGGRRLAIVTNAGGPAVLAADRAEACGLRVDPPSATLRRRLADRLPPFCGIDNPFDLTVQASGDTYRDVLLETLAEADAALAINVNTPYLDAATMAEGVVSAAARTGKPIVASFLAGRPAEAALPVLHDGGVPNFATGERAVRVLARMAREGDAKRPANRTPDRHAAQPLPWTRSPLEPEAMEWLAELGFPVLGRRWAATEEAAAAAVREFGGPVAMKVVSPDLLHKSDVGGVQLNVGPDAVSAVFRELRALADGASFHGVLVTPMVADAVEMLVGVSRDPQFGPVIACGIGGIHAEMLADVALRVAPVPREEARSMVDDLRGASLLRGVRGQPPRDLDALAELIAGVSELPFRFPTIAELDLNPVFLFDAGLRLADVRILLGDEPAT